MGGRGGQVWMQAQGAGAGEKGVVGESKALHGDSGDVDGRAGGVNGVVIDTGEGKW